MDLKILKVNSLDEIEKIKVDNFIMDKMSNGEFINTIKYLSYHPLDRFSDDSIVVKDINSGVIKCVLMAASIKDEPNIIISHPGTTFSGLIFSRKININEIKELIELVELYYKKKYKKIELKMEPLLYSSQPNQEIDYMLMKKGFKLEYTALANVIDLTKIKEEQELFQLYNSKRRNQVKKPIKNNNYDFIQMEEISETVWTNMNTNINMKFGAKTTHTYSEIKKLQMRFHKNIIPFATYRNDGKYGAFALVYKFKNVFHTQYLDMNYELSSEYPNLYLIHNLIKLAISEGYKYFSFGASTEKGGEYLNEGLYGYKNGFGGGSILLPKYVKGE